MAFLGSPVCVTAKLLSPSPRVCTDGVRSLARSYGDVITKFSRPDKFTKIPKEWGSARAPSVRGSSAKNEGFPYSFRGNNTLIIPYKSLQ